VKTAYEGECYSSEDAWNGQCQHTNGEVRSVLRNTETGECVAMLHPVGTIIQFRDEAEDCLSGTPHLTWMNNTVAEGKTISNRTADRMRPMEVVLHGSAPGTTAPTPQDMATAPYVDRRVRLQDESPRTVRWLQNVTPTVRDCDWTASEWFDYRREQEQRRFCLEVSVFGQ